MWLPDYFHKVVRFVETITSSVRALVLFLEVATAFFHAATGLFSQSYVICRKSCLDHDPSHPT
jgi:hypothetical protein